MAEELFARVRRLVELAVAEGRRAVAEPAHSDGFSLRRTRFQVAAELTTTLTTEADRRARDAFGRLSDADPDAYAWAWLDTAVHLAATERTLIQSTWHSPARPREDRHLHWPQSYGLLDGKAAVRRHAGARYADLAARFYPDAAGDDLDLGVDLMSWFFLFDDLFGGPEGEDPTRARALVESVAQVLRRPAAPSDVPVVRAFSDLWRRSCDGMSPQWRRSTQRSTGAPISPGTSPRRYTGSATSCPRSRNICCCAGRTIGVYPTVDLAERIGRFEVPEHVYADNVPKAIRHVAAEVDTIHNDLCSVEKEEARGEIHNLLLILESGDGARVPRPLRRCAMFRSRTERFLVLEAELPALCDSLRLTEAQRVSVRRLADSLRAVMRGDYDWAEQSGRYANENIPREQETAQ